MTRASASSPVHQGAIRARMLQAYIGQMATDYDCRKRNYANINPQAADVRSLTVDAFIVGDYVFVFNGVAHTVTSVAGDVDVTGVATRIRNYMNATGAIYGVVTVAQVAGVLTLTGRLAGFTFTLTDADANLTSALVSAAADASDVEFGRALVRTGFQAAGNDSVENAIELAAKADTATMNVQVDTWTVADPGIGQFIGATLRIEGLPQVISERVPWDASLDTTLDNLATVLNAAITDLGYNLYVSVAGPAGAPGAGQIRFTGVAGVDYASMVTADDAAGYPAITVVSDRDFASSLPWSFGGVALRVSDIESTSPVNTASVAAYGSNSTMLVLDRGEVWVENSEVLVYGGQVFVDLAAGEGRFYGAAAAGRVPLPIARAEWVKSGRSIDGEDLGLLRLK